METKGPLPRSKESAISRPCVPYGNMPFLKVRGHRLIPSLEVHLLSALRGSLFKTFLTTLIYGGRLLHPQSEDELVHATEGSLRILRRRSGYYSVVSQRFLHQICLKLKMFNFRFP
jgi:hypothetical protein